ncbi:uncharacterized protein ACMZJ9_015214 [Mantella aurantiaca]
MSACYPPYRDCAMLLQGGEQTYGTHRRLSTIIHLVSKQIHKYGHTITSSDGSSNRNPPERCPRPLYSRDSTQEDLTIPHHHQVDGNPPERCLRPLYSQDSTQEDLTIPHHHQVDGNPPERCPRPLYSRDSTQDDLTIPHHHQDEEVKDIKVEVKKEEEETMVRGDQQSMEEGERIMEIKKEESSLHMDTSPRLRLSYATGLCLWLWV